ncbi:MAG: hypothetical protein WD793_14425 [Steroidobacteraceae bacterium]
METERDKPIDREAWSRLLDGDDAPPALTDARIRAAAHRAVAPRARRWWLPASLAASLLLAVLVVQWQYGEQDRPVVMSESDYAAPAAEEAVSRQDAPAPPAPPARAVAPAPEQSAKRESRAPDEPSADAATQERDELSEMKVEGGRRRADWAQATPATPVPGVTQQDLAGNSAGVVGELEKSREVLPAPEDWYASIEGLRAAGRHEEADRELERLNAAYPGWLEKNHPRNH